MWFHIYLAFHFENLYLSFIETIDQISVLLKEPIFSFFDKNKIQC